jgi:O-antigen/teichoic acid export membrane protein
MDSLLFGADERGEATRMSLIAFAVRVCSAAIAFLSQVLLARWMGSFEYGIFVFVWTTVLIVGSLSCLGIHTTVIRFIPEYQEKGMLAEQRGLLFASRIFVLAASTAITAIGAAGIWLLRDHMENYYVAPFLVGMVCMPMIAMSDLLQGMSRANSWALLALAPTYIVRPMLVLIFMAIVLVAGHEPTATNAVIVSIAATYVTTLAQLVQVGTRSARKLPAGPRRTDLRRWFIVSVPIFLIESFFFLLTNADVLMVGAFMKPDDVAVYFATAKTLALVHFVYFAVKAGVAQRYARFTHGERDKLAAFARETVSWTFWPSLAMALVVLALGKPMLMLFGPGFDAGYPLLFLLVAGVVIRAAVGPCESLLTMSGHQNVCALIYGLTLAVNIVLSVLLIPSLGLWGAALATAAATLFEAAALSFTVWRRLGFSMAIFLPAGTSKETA